MPAQQAESPPLLISQKLVGPLERGPHRKVFCRQRIQRCSLVSQVGGNVSEQLVPMVPKPPGDEPDRQRQPSTRVQDLPHRITVHASLLADQVDEQPLRLIPAQYVKGERVGVSQSGQLAPAGDQHQTTGRLREQRQHLIAGSRVVQHDQLTARVDVVSPLVLAPGQVGFDRLCRYT